MAIRTPGRLATPPGLPSAMFLNTPPRIRGREMKVTVIAALAVALGITSGASAAFVVTSKNIRNGTIQLVDISPRAKAGLRGRRGPQGRPGISSITEASATLTILPSGRGSAVATCPCRARADLRRLLVRRWQRRRIGQPPFRGTGMGGRRFWSVRSVDARLRVLRARAVERRAGWRAERLGRFPRPGNA